MFRAGDEVLLAEADGVVARKAAARVAPDELTFGVACRPVIVHTDEELLGQLLHCFAPFDCSWFAATCGGQLLHGFEKCLRSNFLKKSFDLLRRHQTTLLPVAFLLYI